MIHLKLGDGGRSVFLMNLFVHGDCRNYHLVVRTENVMKGERRELILLVSELLFIKARLELVMT